LNDALKPNQDPQCGTTRYTDLVLNDAYACFEIFMRAGIFQFNVALQGESAWRGFLEAEGYKLVSLKIAGAVGIKLWPGVLHFEFDGQLSIESDFILKHTDLIKYALIGLAKDKAFRRDGRKNVRPTDQIVSDMVAALGTMDPGYDTGKAATNEGQPEFVGSMRKLFMILRRSVASEIHERKDELVRLVGAGTTQLKHFLNAFNKEGGMSGKKWKKAQQQALRIYAMEMQSLFTAQGRDKVKVRKSRFSLKKSANPEGLKGKSLMRFMDSMLESIMERALGDFIEKIGGVIAKGMFGSDETSFECSDLPSEPVSSRLTGCPDKSGECYLSLLGEDSFEFGPGATENPNQVLVESHLAKIRPRTLCSVATGLDGLLENEANEDLVVGLEREGISVSMAVLAMMPQGFQTLKTLLETTMSSMTPDYSNLKSYMEARVANVMHFTRSIEVFSELLLDEPEEYMAQGAQERLEETLQAISSSSGIYNRLVEQIEDNPMASMDPSEEKTFAVEFTGELKLAAARVKLGKEWDDESSWDLCTTDRSDAQAGWIQSKTLWYTLVCTGTGKCKAATIPETRTSTRSLYITLCPSFPGVNHFCYTYTRSKAVERSVVPGRQSTARFLRKVGVSSGSTHRLQLRLPFQGTASELLTLGTLLARQLTSTLQNLEQSGGFNTGPGDDVKEGQDPTEEQQRSWNASIVASFAPLLDAPLRVVTAESAVVRALAGQHSSVLMLDIFAKFPKNGHKKLAATLTLRNDMSLGTGMLFQALEKIVGGGTHIHVNDAVVLDLSGIALLTSCTSAPEPMADQVFAGVSTDFFN
jgi:hypothetical protein